MNQTQSLYPEISQFISQFDEMEDLLSTERKESLKQVADYIRHCQDKGITANLIFICTHNSRRSHFGQIWAKTLADYYGVPNVQSWSGGTEATAFNPNAIQALRTAGFYINELTEAPNPHYSVQYSDHLPSQEAWSKVYSDPANPQQGFCAIMTCSEADEACPLVFGAEVRVSLPYQDPKKSDGTPQQAAIYLERCKQIGGELAWMYSAL